MAIPIIDKSQRRAARVVGFCYLFSMAVGIFAESYVGGRLIVPDNAAQTARNIIANERLFRLGIAGYLLSQVSDVVLIAALYATLSRISQNLALFATLTRAVQVAVGVVATLSGFDVLRLLSSTGALQTFSSDQLAGLARIPIGAHGTGINVSFVFLGIGSAVFGYLWLKSKYIPTALAALGVFGSLLLAAGSFAFIIFPEFAGAAQAVSFAPLGIFEIAMGLLLLLRGLPSSVIREPDAARADKVA
jgi:hypothetical protein